MAKYFSDVKTLNQLKAQYRRLAMLHHPDRGGDGEIMKAINAEHDRLFEFLKTMHNKTADDYHKTTETPEEFRRIIEALMKLGGLEIELCGSWLWIGGNTKEHREALKAAGCRWSSSKKLWYWHHPEEGRRWKKREASMSEIRSKYGSQTFSGGEMHSKYPTIGEPA